MSDQFHQRAALIAEGRGLLAHRRRQDVLDYLADTGFFVSSRRAEITAEINRVKSKLIQLRAQRIQEQPK